VRRPILSAAALIFFAPSRRTARRRTGSRPTPNRRFELMFRFYAPTKALFDKEWTLPDVEKVGAR
jgi:hypothetical protein